MEYEVLGFPPDGPSLTLDWQAFSYAGKFEMTNTGKAVLRSNDEIVAAAAFNGDRETPEQAWIRYMTVKTERQGEGLGTELARRLTETLFDHEYERVTIAVNNPIAYRALSKAGYHFTGRETGVAELVLEAPGERDPDSYRAGLTLFANRDLPEREQEPVASWLEEAELPPTVNGIPFAPSTEREDNGTR
ncbi:MAG: GNAT family N-acetyltransferase [Halodesulfurarchaeum sp.]|nr:GNAT family N-acetyltransferase [Halodesulfurarchaeum sp.]